MKMKIFNLVLLSFLTLIFAGCAPTTLEERYKNMDAEQIYNHGEKMMFQGKYDEASKDFEGLEALYPFGPYAQPAQRDIIYAYYKNNDAASALAAADRYIHLYPQSPDVDYAYYMKGLINFDRGRNWLQNVFKENPAENDLSYMQQSFVDFNELLERFPNSKYAADAQKRMIYIRNTLAQNELDSANFYMRHKAYVAAANRATYIVDHFQGSPQVISALIILVKANRALGLNQQSNDALKVLQYSYPDSKEYQALLKNNN